MGTSQLAGFLTLNTADLTSEGIPGSMEAFSLLKGTILHPVLSSCPSHDHGQGSPCLKKAENRGLVSSVWTLTDSFSARSKAVRVKEFP